MSSPQPNAIVPAEITRKDANTVVATAKISGKTYTLTAVLAPAMPKFVVKDGKMTYTSTKQLDGNVQCTAKIGTNDVNITLENGVFLIGPLEPPIGKETNVAGQGQWAST